MNNIKLIPIPLTAVKIELDNEMLTWIEPKSPFAGRANFKEVDGQWTLPGTYDSVGKTLDFEPDESMVEGDMLIRLGDRVHRHNIPPLPEYVKNSMHSPTEWFPGEVKKEFISRLTSIIAEQGLEEGRFAVLMEKK